MLTNQSSGLVLDDPGLSKTPGEQMIQWTANGQHNQSWFFSSQGNGHYVIMNMSSGLLLTDPNSSAKPLTPLEQQTETRDDSQLWSLIPQGGGYLIQNKGSGLVIDDPNFSSTPGTGIILYPRKDASKDGSNQVWMIQ